MSEKNVVRKEHQNVILLFTAHIGLSLYYKRYQIYIFYLFFNCKYKFNL